MSRAILHCWPDLGLECSVYATLSCTLWTQTGDGFREARQRAQYSRTVRQRAVPCGGITQSHGEEDGSCVDPEPEP